jgi:hypothetical protein
MLAFIFYVLICLICILRCHISGVHHLAPPALYFFLSQIFHLSDILLYCKIQMYIFVPACVQHSPIE